MSVARPQALPSPGRSLTRSFKGDRYLRSLLAPPGSVWFAILIMLVAGGLLGPLLVSYGPTFQIRSADLLAPSPAHPFGTDQLGRDLLSRVLSGIRVDLAVAFLSPPAAAVCGTGLGLLAASGLRYVDTAVTRLFDVILSFPALIFGVGIAAVMTPGLGAIMTTVFLVNVPIFGRLTRDAVISLREREFVTAALSVGVGTPRLLYVHILPNTVDALIVQLALSMSFAVFLEGGMSFVGIGVQPPDPSLGSLLHSSLPYLATNPTYALGPMVVLTALVLSLNMTADALNRGVLQR